RLREDAYSNELAELESAVDRSLLVRPEDETSPASESWTIVLDAPRMNRFSGSFHFPPGRFPALLLSCLSGADARTFEAAVRALMEPAQKELLLAEAELSVRPRLDGLPPRLERSKFEEESATLATLLLQARLHGDADVRAGALLLSPYYRLPLDGTRFRQDVLVRPQIARLAAESLLEDRSLPSAEWTALFSEMFATPRKASPNPLACLEAGPWAVQADDAYCALLATLQIRTASAGGDDAPDPGRTREVMAFTTSPAAPPEIRLQGKLGRVMAG